MTKKESDFFKEAELACKCGCGDSEMDNRFMILLDSMRIIVNEPLYITSAKRCEKHNAEVGGKPNSAHLTGEAADIDCKSGVLKFKIVKAAMRVGIGRVGVGKEFVHVDSSTILQNPTLWAY